MEPGAVGLFGGLLFLLIAVVGGGFTIKEIAMPAVPRWARVASLAIGAALVVPYFAGDRAADAPRPARPATEVGASVSKPSGATRGYVYRPSGTDISPESIEVFELAATAPHDPPAVGDRPGVWDFWPCYVTGRGDRARGCPDGWRSFQVDVGR